MKRREADGLCKINVNVLKNQGYFTPDWKKSGSLTWTSNYHGVVGTVGIEVSTKDNERYLRIMHTNTKCSTCEEKHLDYKVSLTTTPCNYGGSRYWFLCTGYGCGRRVGTLYLAGERFACRHCYNLTYERSNWSQRYKGFVSIADLEVLEEKVGYYYYAGNPTRKYKRYLKMERRLCHQLGVLT